VRRALWPVAGVALVALALAGGQPASIAARAAGFALGIASVVVLTGWSGQLNLHVAAIGLGWGAYAAAGLAANGVPSLVAILVAPFVVAPAALLVGVAAVRFRGLELAIATLAAGLAFEQMAFQNLGKWLARATSGTQFQSSLIELARPAGFGGDRAYALLAAIVVASWLAGAALLGHGRTGRILHAVRGREVVAEARGVPVFWWRVAAFVASISLAAAGGALLAGQTGAVTPDSFGLILSLQLLAVAVLAGVRRLEAAVLGAGLVVLAQEAGGIPVLNVIAGDRIDLVFGVGLIVAVWLQARRRFESGNVTAEAIAEVPGAPGALEPRAFAPTRLRVERVTVSFGTDRVLDAVSIRVGEGEVCGLVGGNGAGKTTLFNCITGLVTPAAGRVFFAGQDITELAPHRRARLGIARTFQGVELFGGLTIVDSLMLIAGLGGDHDEALLRTRAHGALEQVGIGPAAAFHPSDLPLATLRLAELATALVGDPSLVLLDEPLAGLDARERTVVLAAIARLRAQGRSIVIVEHDCEAVATIADRIYELRAGRAVPYGRERRTEEARVAAGA